MEIEILAGIAASVIINSVKNVAHKDKLKGVMLKIWRTIGNAYLGDPDFK